jgi:hypothetical protein
MARSRARGKNGSRLKYRRSPFLVSYWSGKQLVIENFATGRRITSDPLAITILNFFDRWRSFREFLSQFSEYQTASLHESLDLLVKHSILERSDRNRSPSEQAMQSWAAWNPAAGFFHSSTKDVEFDTDAEEGFRDLQRLARTNPMPRPVKQYSNAIHVPSKRMCSHEMCADCGRDFTTTMAPHTAWTCCAVEQIPGRSSSIWRGSGGLAALPLSSS